MMAPITTRIIGSMSVMNRAMSEYRAGSPIYDVLLNNRDPLYIMHTEGMIAKYDSPTAKKYPKEQIDPALFRTHLQLHARDRSNHSLGGVPLIRGQPVDPLP